MKKEIFSLYMLNESGRKKRMYVMKEMKKEKAVKEISLKRKEGK